VTAALTLAVGVLVVLAITVLTGYFVAQEFAYMAVDRSQLKARAEAGDGAATRALAVTRRTSFMLSGAQLGITVTGLLVGYVAEPLIGGSIAALIGGDVPRGWAVAAGAVVAVVFSTVVQMVFGELFPKNLAIARPAPVARWLAGSTTLYLAVFGWLISIFDAASNALLRLLRIEPVHDVEHAATPRDLAYIVAESRRSGDLPAELSTLLDRVLEFPTRTAEHAMVPRTLTDVVSAGESVAAVLATMATGHSRYPVTGSSTDDLLGVVRLQDLLGAPPEDSVESHCRPAVIVPASLPLTVVQARLVDADEEMALVIDEYGGFAGIVTVEDMAEELVGEIADEHDPPFQDIVRVDGGWLVGGQAHLDEVCRTLSVDLRRRDAETLAGLVVEAFGGLPAVGDVVEVRGGDGSSDILIAEVRAIERHVPAELFVSVGQTSETTSTTGPRHE